MTLGKFKRYFLVLTMLLGLIIQGCSSEYDEFADPTDSSKNEITSAETTAYDAVLQSSEFKEYDSRYTNLMSIIDEVASRMTEEDKQELSKLSKLYISDPQRYETLFIYEVTNIFGNDSIRAKDALVSVLEAKESLMKNKRLSIEIKGNEKMIFAELQMNRDVNTMFVCNPTPKLKTREEGGSDKLARCKSLCKESYDNRTDLADSALLCSTAVNVAVCIGSGGLAAFAGVVTQLGITAAYRNEKAAAAKDYDICIRGCELSYGK